MANDYDNITEIKGKSEDDFERNITYISAGTLVLSVTFLEKLVAPGGASNTNLLVVAWVFLTATLLINLVSHQLASWFGEKAEREIRSNDENHVGNVYRRNFVMRSINIFTVLTLITGITFLLCFSAKNITAMTEKDDNSIQNPLHEQPGYIEKGRTYTPNPHPATPSPKPTKETSGDTAKGGSDEKK